MLKRNKTNSKTFSITNVYLVWCFLYWRGQGKGMFLCFSTDNLEKVHERAVLLGLNPSEIRQPEPDAKYFYVYDPDGVSVQFREYK